MVKSNESLDLEDEIPVEDAPIFKRTQSIYYKNKVDKYSTKIKKEGLIDNNDLVSVQSPKSPLSP